MLNSPSLKSRCDRVEEDASQYHLESSSRSTPTLLAINHRRSVIGETCTPFIVQTCVPQKLLKDIPAHNPKSTIFHNANQMISYKRYEDKILNVHWKLIEMDLTRSDPAKDRAQNLTVAVDRPSRWFSKDSHGEDGEDEASFGDGGDTRTRICLKWRRCVGKLRAKHIRFCTLCTKIIPSYLTDERTVVASMNHAVEIARSSSHAKIRTCRKWRKRVLQLRDNHRQTCSSCRVNVSSRICAVDVKWRLIEIDIPKRVSPKDRYRAYIDHWRSVTDVLGSFREVKRKHGVRQEPNDRCRDKAYGEMFDIKLRAKSSTGFLDFCEWRLGVHDLSQRKIGGDRCRNGLKDGMYVKVCTDDEDEGIEIEEKVMNVRKQQTLLSYEQNRFFFEVTDENIQHWMPGEGIGLEF
ncbi:hypothetical protein KM043_016783 [Ampulex compressa]|nr:hypothetical protein KM043_016783 [Ampulex compressa]